MDWSPLLSTLLGGALVVGGSFLAQIRSERQALGREDRDRRAAVERDERQREQEREVWGMPVRPAPSRRSTGAYGSSVTCVQTNIFNCSSTLLSPRS